MKKVASAFGRTSIALAFVACSAQKDPPLPTAIVVGIQSNNLVGIVDWISISAKINGADVVHEKLTYGLSAFPREARVALSNDDPHAVLQVLIEGRAIGSDSEIVLKRTAEAKFVAHETKLLRIQLDTRCLTGFFGSFAGCPSSQTCVAGRCKDPLVFESDLEPYAANWAEDSADACRDENAGAPEVKIGTGQTSYAPLHDGDTLRAERGPQGGHHLWIAVRIKNIRQNGSQTVLAAVQPDTNTVVPKTSFVVRLDPDTEGFCKLFGLRYQLDNGGVDYTHFLGKPLDVTVEVIDRAGLRATDHARIQVDAEISCPPGMPGC